MRIAKTTYALAAALLSFSTLTTAQESSAIKGLYLGGGVSLNDYDTGLYNDDDAIGFQFFAGLPLPVNLKQGRLLAEVGYMDAGDIDVNTPVGTRSTDGADGIWANAVFEYPVHQNFDILGRIGLDFGDDDGLMLGAGVGIPIAHKVDLRFEYVIRDNINSLQANVTFEL